MLHSHLLSRLNSADMTIESGRYDHRVRGISVRHEMSKSSESSSQRRLGLSGLGLTRTHRRCARWWYHHTVTLSDRLCDRDRRRCQWCHGDSQSGFKFTGFTGTTVASGATVTLSRVTLSRASSRKVIVTSSCTSPCICIETYPRDLVSPISAAKPDQSAKHSQPPARESAAGPGACELENFTGTSENFT